MRGFIKRFFPFFVTFILGLFVASFFVAITAPKFQFNRGKKHREYHRLKYENKCLKEKNRQLQRELEAEKFHGDFEIMNLDVPPPPIPPMPPPAPVAPRRAH